MRIKKSLFGIVLLLFITLGTVFSVYADNANKSVEEIKVTDVNNNESQIKVDVKNPAVSCGIKKILVAVWSKTNGQDDLVWYNTSKSGTTYTCTVPVNSHKTLGYYYVHVYAVDNNNKYIFLGADSFDINIKPTADVTVEYVDKINGKMFIRVSDINAPAGISKVQVPIYCSSDQSDLKWYTAKAEADGTYTVLADIKEHKNKWGKYKIFVYIGMKNGIEGYAVSSTYNLTKKSSDKPVTNIVGGEGIICEEINSKTGYYNISMKAPEISGNISYIEYAIHSYLNGQDDILWFNAYKNSNGSYDSDVNMSLFNDYGKYNVSAYAVMSDGSRVFVKSGSFSLNKPSIGNIATNGENRSKGTFKVVLSDVKNTSAIGKLQVGVKSSAKNAETIWYDATISANGEYIATVNIKNHKYATGRYEIVSRIVDFRNENINSLSATYDFNVKYQYYYTEDVAGAEKSMGVFLYKLDVPAGVKSVKFAVWSADKGQDDLVWYNADFYNNYYYYYVPIKNHKTLGKYHVHAYYVAPDGSYKFIGGETFSINSKASGKVSVSNINGTKGTFKVTVSDISALSGVSRVLVPVWSKSDQSDIKWYEAAKQADGTYVAEVKVANHKHNFGTYNIHTYVVMGNGIRNIISMTKTTISPLNYIKVEKVNEGKAKITLMNAGNGKAAKVYFPTWSKTNGQDDIKWYSASYAGGGNWTATIETKNHKNYGAFTTHVYVEYNGKKSYVGATEFNLKGLDYSQMLSRFYTVSQNNANGTFNMSKALLSFNGVIVQPGQTISFFNIAGPCGKNQGYKVAGTVQGTGYGGGICQASTTLYGGALRAGMTIVERRSHSSKSVYVPVGQDAMVSYGSSDFKFRNDHSRPVKIVTYVVGKTLYVEFWGVQEDWYDNVVVNSWATGSKSAAAERIYYKNGVIVKRERLTNSYYPKG